VSARRLWLTVDVKAPFDRRRLAGVHCLEDRAKIELFHLEIETCLVRLRIVRVAPDLAVELQLPGFGPETRRHVSKARRCGSITRRP